MSVAFQQSPAFLRGRLGEQVVRSLLQRRGWYVISTADYCGTTETPHAPWSQGAHDDRIIVPDLDIARLGIRRWAEVKAKWDATFTNITGTYDHGIGYRLWQQYRRIHEQTGCDVWLFILEEKRQLLLAESLDVLGMGRHYDGDAMDRGGMMFWSRWNFRMHLALNTIPGLFDDSIPLPFEVKGRTV